MAVIHSNNPQKMQEYISKYLKANTVYNVTNSLPANAYAYYLDGNPTIRTSNSVKNYDNFKTKKIKELIQPNEKIKLYTQNGYCFLTYDTDLLASKGQPIYKVLVQANNKIIYLPLKLINKPTINLGDIGELIFAVILYLSFIETYKKQPKSLTEVYIFGQTDKEADEIIKFIVSEIAPTYQRIQIARGTGKPEAKEYYVAPSNTTIQAKAHKDDISISAGLKENSALNVIRLIDDEEIIKKVKPIITKTAKSLANENKIFSYKNLIFSCYEKREEKIEINLTGYCDSKDSKVDAMLIVFDKKKKTSTLIPISLKNKSNQMGQSNFGTIISENATKNIFNFFNKYIPSAKITQELLNGLYTSHVPNTNATIQNTDSFVSEVMNTVKTKLSNNNTLINQLLKNVPYSFATKEDQNFVGQNLFLHDTHTNKMVSLKSYDSFLANTKDNYIFTVDMAGKDTIKIQCKRKDSSKKPKDFLLIRFKKDNKDAHYSRIYMQNTPEFFNLMEESV